MHLNTQSIAQKTYTYSDTTAAYFVYDTSDSTFKFVNYGKRKNFTNTINYNTQYAICMIYMSLMTIIPMPGVNIITEGCTTYKPNDTGDYFLRNDPIIDLYNSYFIESRYNKVYRPFRDGKYDLGTIYKDGEVYRNEKYTKLGGGVNVSAIDNKYICWEIDTTYTGTAYIFNPLQLRITVFQNLDRLISGYSNNKYIEFEMVPSHICLIVYHGGGDKLINDFVSSVMIAIQPKNNILNTNKTNLFDYKTSINGSECKWENGNVVTNSVCCYQEEFIPVYPGKKIYVNNYFHEISLYDFNYNNIASGFTSNDSYSAEGKSPVYEYIIPEACYYIRISTLINCKNKIQVSYRHEDINIYNRDIVNQKQLNIISRYSGVNRLFTATNMINNDGSYTLQSNNNSALTNRIRIRCNDIVAGLEIKFNIADNDLYFGFDSSIIEQDTSNMGQSALIHLNTTNKTINFEVGNILNAKSSGGNLSVYTANTYTGNINLNYNYLLILKKYSVCKYDIEFKCVNTGETLAAFTHNYTVNSSNPDSVGYQARGWNGPYCYVRTGDITQYNMYMNYIGPLNPRVAVYGDSYIENLGKNYLASWANRLYDALDGEVFIAGYGGCSISGLMWRLPVEMNLCNPKYSVLATGVNDSYRSDLSAYYEGVEKFIKWCELRNTEPVLITCPICESGGNSNTEKAREITDFVRNSGYKYIDYRAALCTEDDNTADWNKYLSDKVHPNIAGGAAIFTWIQANLPELVY